MLNSIIQKGHCELYVNALGCTWLGLKPCCRGRLHRFTYFQQIVRISPRYMDMLVVSNKEAMGRTTLMDMATTNQALVDVQTCMVTVHITKAMPPHETMITD